MRRYCTAPLVLLVLILLCRLGSSADAAPAAWKQSAALSAPEAVQAAAADDKYVYAIANKLVAKYDRQSGQRIATSTGEATHLNSGFFHGGKLYCAHSNYPIKPEKSEIKVLDPATMQLTTFKDFGSMGGSLTWCVRHDGHWWCNFARYGADNAATFLIQFDDQWREAARWTYPPEVTSRLKTYSLSGGIWRDGLLLTTDHDNGRLYCLRVPKQGSVLEYVATQSVPFTGQGIAADPKTGGLVGINRAKKQIVFATLDTAKAAATTAATADRPNIIFILADDAGLGDFGCYGGKLIPTPNIDRLAKEGMRFTNAYSGSAVCAPTRCVLMTGQHTGHCIRRANQSKHGLIPLAAEQATVASVLKKAGYTTGGFGKWGLGNPGTTGVPETHGFDVWFGYYDQVHAHAYFTDHLIRNSEKVALPGNADGKRGQYSHDVIVEETLAFIEKNKDQPQFVYAAWTLPHGKYEIPSNAPFAEKPWPEPVKNYAAMVAKLDADVGRLLAKLKSLGLDERTIVVFSSDNGATPQSASALASSAGLRGTKRFLFEGGIRAPLAVRWPGKVKPGTTSDLLTSHVDFLATAAELANAEAPAETDAISIAPTLLGREQKQRAHLYWEIYEPLFQQAVRLGDWKGYRTGTREPLQLYNLKTDPTEATDVAQAHPDVVKRIEAIIIREHVPSPHFDAPDLAKPGKKKQGKKARKAKN